SGGGNCFSDFYSLHLDPSNGWVAGTAPWNNIKQGNPPGSALESLAWAVGSSDGSSLLFYGQTQCTPLLSKDPNSQHTFTSTSASILFTHGQDGSWSQTKSELDVLGPRLVKDDDPVPVQVVDTTNHVVYTFVYDTFNPQLGAQLYSFSTAAALPTNLIFTKRTPLNTTQPPPPPPPAPLPPVNGTNVTVPLPPVPAPIVLAPFVDEGAAVYIGGTIVVLGGGRVGGGAGGALSGDNVDPASGWYKMDRCWEYNIAANVWTIRNLTSPAIPFKYPSPRRLHALAVVGTKIYMHGGNTTVTVPTDSYASDLWVLDTQTWAWSKGPDSEHGRAGHTLIHAENTLLSVSGFDFESNKTKVAQNAFIMIYDMDSHAWGTQFGTIPQTFFQQHGIVVIVASVGGVLAILIIAAVALRVARRHSRRSGIKSYAGMLSRKGTNKPFAAPVGTARSGHADAVNRLSGMTATGHGSSDSHIDLSAMPRASESTAFDSHYQHHQSFNQYAPTNIQQQVPLMSANELEQQREDALYPYVDRDAEVKDMRPLSHAPGFQ
ncbi:Acyl-CoA-binding domain-containing protein 5, partial [Dissophora globulifera]